MKKLIALLPLIGIASPLASNFQHNQIPTHKHILAQKESPAQWKVTVKKTSIEDLMNHFRVLTREYGWTKNDAKISNFNFSYNDNGSLWGAIVELNNSLEATSIVYVEYNADASYNIKQWKVSTLPKYTNNQIIWRDCFNHWKNSKGTDTRNISYLAYGIAKSWSITNQIADFTGNGRQRVYSENYRLLHNHLNNPYAFLRETYTKIANVQEVKKNNDVTIKAQFRVWFELDFQSHFYYMNWHLTYNKTKAYFDINQIHPDFSDWKVHS